MEPCSHRKICHFYRRQVQPDAPSDALREKLFQQYCSGDRRKNCAILLQAAKNPSSIHPRLLPSGEIAKDVNEVLLLACIGLAVLIFAWVLVFNLTHFS